MQEDWHKHDYHPDSGLVTIPREYLQLVDTVLLAALGQSWERVRDVTPLPYQTAQTWSFSPEELRSSHLGQALLTIADYASGGFVPIEKTKRAMKRVYRLLFGDVLSEAFTIPSQFHKTDLGKLFHAAYARMYHRDELMTPAQAYRTLGIARQSLYDRLAKGKLTPVYSHGGLRLLKEEILGWKAQRDQRINSSKQQQ